MKISSQNAYALNINSPQYSKQKHKITFRGTLVVPKITENAFIDEYARKLAELNIVKISDNKQANTIAVEVSEFVKKLKTGFEILTPHRSKRDSLIPKSQSHLRLEGDDYNPINLALDDFHFNNPQIHPAVQLFENIPSGHLLRKEFDKLESSPFALETILKEQPQKKRNLKGWKTYKFKD